MINTTLDRKIRPTSTKAQIVDTLDQDGVYLSAEHEAK